MMIDLNELQYFAQVAKVQSFTLTARHFNVPKSSVSRAVKSLEARLGLRLVERTTRSVALTEAGTLYLEHCHRVLEEAELADHVVGALQAKPRGKLRVGAPITFVRAVLGPILGEFLVQYPELRLHLKLIGGGNSDREDNLDVVIRPGPLEDSGMLAKPLMRIHLAAYASPSYLAAHETPDSPEALRQHRCITIGCGAHGEPADSVIWRLRRGVEVRAVRVDSHAAVPDPTMSQQLAVAGIGVALISQSMAQRAVAQGQLQRILAEWEPDPVELHAVYPSPLHSSPKVRVFLQFLHERMGRIEPAS